MGIGKEISGGGGIMMNNKQDDHLIEEIMKHLDKETQMGVTRMSVEMDDTGQKTVGVSHKCCNMYGRPANETVGLLDSYTDLNAGCPDNENR